MKENAARIVSCMVVIVFFLCGCVSRSKGPEPARLTIAFQEWVGYGPFYLAQDKGFCEEEGIELIFVDEQLESSRRDALQEGMLDFEAGTLDQMIIRGGQDVPAVTVMEIDYSFGSDGIVADRRINVLKDLLGKRIALARNDVGETFVSVIFYKAGLSLKDVTIVPKRPDEVAQAFLAGEADACATWEPFLSEALKRPGSHALATTRQHPGIIIDVLNVRRDLLKSNPQFVKGLMRAWFKALEYYKAHPVEASEIIAVRFGLSSPEYRRQVEGLKWVDYDRQNSQSELEAMKDIFNTIADLKISDAKFGGKPDAREYINCDLLEKLYENSK